jgi:hypothetical protein
MPARVEMGYKERASGKDERVPRTSREWIRRAALAAFALVAACGARTGLDASPPAPPVTFAGCHQQPWLLFDLSDANNPESEGIYAMRADGSDPHPLTLPHSPAYFPSVSPDGGHLLYATFQGQDAGGGALLYLYDFASRTASLVVQTPQLTYSALSPDGQTVAYVNGYSLHDVAPDGSNDRTLLAGPNSDGSGYGHPTFFDSSTILYGTGGVVGSIGVDGSNNQTLLTTIPGSFQYPNAALSPDDTHIVIGAYCDQGSGDAIRVYPYASLPGASCASGTVLAAAQESASPNDGANDPSWGPDGTIAYGSGQDVWVIPASGGTPMNMTSDLTGDGGVHAATDPVWAPGCAALP